MTSSAKNGSVKIGLALSGGGARGFAHIGIIQELGRLGIPIHCIAGTSAGSIVGGWYAARGNVDEIILFLRKHPWRSFFEFKKVPWNVNAGGLLDMGTAEKKFREYLGDVQIEQLPVPFQAVAVSLKTGAEVDIASGDLVEAMMASSAVPVVFKPRKHGTDYLVDGGLANHLPIDVCFRMGADRVIAADIGTEFSDLQLVSEQGNVGFRPWQIYRMMELVLSTRQQNKGADPRGKDVFTIRPYVSHINVADFGKMDECVLSGRRAVEDQEDALRAFLGMPQAEKTFLEKLFED